MDAVILQLEDIRKEIRRVLLTYDLSVDSPSMASMSEEDYNKFCNLREEETHLEVMIEYRYQMKESTTAEENIATNHQVRIGKRIAELRKAQKISQTKLARLTKLDSGYIGRVERGKIPAGIENLSKIGDALGFELDFVPKNR